MLCSKYWPERIECAEIRSNERTNFRATHKKRMGMLFMLLMLLVLLSVTALEALMSYEALLFSPLAEHQSTAVIYGQKNNIYSDLYVQLNVMTLCMMHNFSSLAEAWLGRNSVCYLVFRGSFMMRKVTRLHSLKLPPPTSPIFNHGALPSLAPSAPHLV